MYKARKVALFLLIAAMILPALPLAAQDEELLDENLLEKFTIHGYFSQAWGSTNGHKYRGMPKGGTADLRNAALQLRFAPTEKDELWVQFAHESVGTSPTNEFRHDLEVDWLFYSRKFTLSTRFRIGRVPLPIGIYNEIKDVGTVLPFYRPSGNFYGEGTWTSDTVDGIVFSQTIAAGRPWYLDFDAYYGKWERIETDGNTLTFGVADIKDALGFYLWLNTPVPGLRVGVGANRFDVSGGVYLPPGVSDQEETRYFSFDGDFDRVVFRSEYSKRTFTGGHWKAFYAELVFRLREKLKLMANYDTGILRFEIPFFATFDDPIEEAVGVGVNYAFRPNLVFKAEHYWLTGYGQIEDQTLNIFFEEPMDTNYVLLSVSVHF